MAIFRYTGPGKHHTYVNGEPVLAKVGDLVELTEAQAHNFRDRFEPVGAAPGAPEGPTAEEITAEAARQLLEEEEARIQKDLEDEQVRLSAALLAAEQQI